MVYISCQTVKLSWKPVMCQSWAEQGETQWSEAWGTLHIPIYSYNIPMYSHILTVLLADCWRFAHSTRWDLYIWVNVNCVATLDAVWIPSFIIIALPTILVYILQSLCISSSAVQEKKQSYHRLNKSLVAQRSCCCYCLEWLMFVTTSCFEDFSVHNEEVPGWRSSCWFQHYHLMLLD